MITYIYDYIFKKKCIKCMILIYKISCYEVYNLALTKDFSINTMIVFLLRPILMLGMLATMEVGN